MCSSFVFELTKADTLNRRPRRTRASTDSQFVAVDENGNIKYPGDKDRPFSPVYQCEESQKRIRQWSAKLHVLYGIPVEYALDVDGKWPRYDLRSDVKARATHPYARSLVYDLRRYSRDNFFGPFMNGFSQDVDWEKLEAIMIVLNYNVKKFVETYGTDPNMLPQLNKPFEGVTPHSFVSPSFKIPKEPRPPLEALDPYNVTGTWMRIVCFLDYNELFGFNFLAPRPPNDEPRHPLETEEAFRLIIMKLEITSIDPPGEDDGQELPRVGFKGLASAVRPAWDPNSVSKIHGNQSLSSHHDVFD